MTIVLVLAFLGVVGIAAGIWSMIFLNRTSTTDSASPGWTRLRVTVFVVGLALGILSCPGTIFLGYPVASGDNAIRVVGIPFMAASFDSQGRDYVGLVTLPSIIGNGVFWFLLPHIVLAVLRKNRRQQ